MLIPLRAFRRLRDLDDGMTTVRVALRLLGDSTWLFPTEDDLDSHLYRTCGLTGLRAKDTLIAAGLIERFEEGWAIR